MSKIPALLLTMFISALVAAAVFAYLYWSDVQNSRRECESNGGYVVDDTSAGSVCIKEESP